MRKKVKIEESGQKQLHLFSRPVPEQISAELEEEVVRLHAVAGSVRKMKALLNMTRKAILAVLKRRGVLPPAPGDGKPQSESYQARYLRKRTSTWRAQGLCYRCGSPPAPGLAVCQKHADQKRNRRLRQKKGREAAGQCNSCGSPLPSSKRKQCEICLAKIRGYHAGRSKARSDIGLCTVCGKAPPTDGLKFCAACTAKHDAYRRGLVLRRAAAGMCRMCGTFPPLPDQRRCQHCLFKGLSEDHFGSQRNAEEIRELWERSGGVCAYSGLPISLGVNAHLDHVMPLSRGGEHTPANLQWAHAVVNQMKFNYTEEEFLNMVRHIYEHRDLARKEPS